MAYLAKGKKADLIHLATELEIEVDPTMTIMAIKNKITGNDLYDEEFAKELFSSIIEERKRKEERELEEQRRKEERELEEQRRKEERELEEQRRKEEREHELRKLEIEAQIRSTQPSLPNESAQHNFDLIKLIPKFRLKEDDIVIYLSLFERQAKRSKVDPKDWVSSLLTLLPSEIMQLIGRESEERFEDYEYIKSLLLKRFKLSPESFRKKFVMHQKSVEKSWRDFCYEITNYFDEWIGGLGITDFTGLRDLIITDQIKKRVPNDVREHFIDNWTKFVSPDELSDKLDEYDSVRNTSKKHNENPSKDRNNEKWRPRTPPSEKNSRNKQSSSQNPSNVYPHRKIDESRKQAFKITCFNCGKEGHTSKFCTKSRQPRNPPEKAQNHLVKTQEKSEVLTAKISIPVSKSMDASRNIDELKLVKVKCGNAILKGIVDTGAQISVVRDRLVTDIPCEGESKIEISSAFGEN